MVRLGFCVGILAACLLGCSKSDMNTGGGNGAAGNGGGSSSGVAASTKLSAATASDIAKLCAAHQADGLKVATAFCTELSFTSSSAAACMMARDKCLSDSGATGPCGGITAEKLKNCDVTVAEFESCTSQGVTWSGGVSCAGVGTTPPAPPACYTSLIPKCASITGSMASPTAGAAGAGH